MAYTDMRIIDNEYLIMLGVGLKVADAPTAYEVHSMFTTCLPHGEPRVDGRANGIMCKDQP
jgi:hypothetical protein